ncbi:30S ribosomal protein S3 [Candidatus Woesebacteria bacterium]|nr:30S ribosomal protein S3 [Candidatus Woesebacteria bacterium]
MGQKVHPNGLRLGITNNWQSRWFFSNKTIFRLAVSEDSKIREHILEKFSSASVTEVDIERQINKILVIIHAVKPGVIIGKGGKGLEEVKNVIVRYLAKPTNNARQPKIDIKIEQVKKPFINARYVAQMISDKLVRGMPHRGVVHNAMNKVTEAGGKGIKVQLGGRIGGAEISRREKYFQGTVPASTIREDVDFAIVPALTKSGYVGVKVWICR